MSEACRLLLCYVLDLSIDLSPVNSHLVCDKLYKIVYRDMYL